MKILFIPSAEIIPIDMQKKFGEIPSALVPLAETTILENILNKYNGLYDKAIIIVYKQKEELKRYIKNKGLTVEIIELDTILDLGYTIYYGLNILLNKYNNIEKLYINFADSLLAETVNKSINDFIYYAKISSSDIWTYFKNEDNKIIEIADKKLLKINPNKALNYENIFVGVFCFSRVKEFRNLLESYIIRNSNSMDSFYAALMAYSKKYKVSLLSVNMWYDVGHSETYLKAKTEVATRSFNSIKIDEKRGVLRKTSENKEKLIDEIKWYLKLPDRIQYLSPRIYDYSLSWDNPYVDMEYYGYHTLHESFLYGDLPLTRWKEIFQKLLFLVMDMEQYKLVPTEKEVKEALYNIYLEKTYNRLEKLKTEERFKCFFNKHIIINGMEYNSLNYYMNILPNLIDKIVLKNFNNEFTIIHGDLCFANILIEDNYNFMRIIDPRGSFGKYDIYGDPRYELAKLLHSLEGKYDFIIEDLFELTYEKNNIQYRIFNKNNAVYKIFNEVFKEKIKDILAIRLIEATLFLSMVPLHSDYPNRQIIMLATGIILLEQVIKEFENNG
ncbi:hypothetical protein [Megamonas sp.]